MELELPRKVGPYVVEAALGRSASGHAFAATHEFTGLPVVLKRIEPPEGTSVEAARREIDALGRLDHPGLCRVVDHGTHDGAPWCALERVEGTGLMPYADLRLGLGRGGVEGADLAAVLTVVRRLCATLAYLHGEGLVHRGLHPGVIVVRPGDFPTIVDYEIVPPEADARSALAAAEQSPHAAYLSPEQVRGEPLDARTDLYALGAMLYEVLTGQPAMAPAHGISTARAHLSRPPLPPSAHLPGLPVKLVAVVLRLLQKRPHDRLGHADDVAAALADLGASETPPTWPSPRPYLYAPAFVGRLDALRDLRASMDLLDYGGGHLVLVEGDSGAGKSSLVREAARVARSRGIAVRFGQAARLQPTAIPGDDPPPAPLSLLRPLRDAVIRPPHGQASGVPPGAALVLAPYDAAPPVTAPERPALPALPPDGARIRLFQALQDALLALFGGEPGMVVLDDLHRADDLSVRWLVHLGRTGALERIPVLIVGTYDPEHLTPAVEELARQPHARHVRLGRMDKAGIAAMVEAMLAVRPAPVDLVDGVSRRSGGSPLGIAEHLRAAVGEGILRRTAEGHWDAARVELAARGELPGSLDALVARRLESVPPAARRLLQAVAVIGAAPVEILARTSRLGSADLRGALTELLRRQVLVLTDEGAVAFSHEKLRSVAYEHMGGDVRRELHREAAVSLEELSPSARPDVLGAIALHWERADEPLRSRPWHLEAAGRALALVALPEAEHHARAFLALGPDALVRRRLAVDLLSAQGRDEEAILELERALADAEAAGDVEERVRGHLAMARVLVSRGRTAEALAQGDAAADANKAVGDPVLHAEARAIQAECYAALGQVVEARELEQRALEIHVAAGDVRGEAKARLAMARIERLEGRPEAAIEEREAAIGLLRREGAGASLVAALAEQAGALEAASRAPEARANLREALDLADRIGDTRSLGDLLARLGSLAAAAGDVDEAVALAQRALASHRDAGRRGPEGRSAALLAGLLLQLGRVDDARHHVRQALALHREAGDRESEARTLLDMADLERLAAGRLDVAQRLLREADALAVGDGMAAVAALGLCRRGHLALARGRSATTFLERARARLREAAAPEDAVMADLDRLQRAIAAADDGGQLVRGTAAADVPAGLRRHIAEHGDALGLPV